jgi:hypothetical protein
MLGRLLLGAMMVAGPAWADGDWPGVVGNIQHPAFLEISDQDARDGVVELPHAASFELAQGYTHALAVSVAESASYIDHIEASVSQAAPSGAHERQFVVGFRIHLKRGARAGRFAWPLGLAVAVP